MEKVLLATIGSPRYTSPERNGYLMTDYHYKNLSFQSCYTFDALNGMLGFDRIILMGTAKSSWDELYKYLYDEADRCSVHLPSVPFDPAYHARLKWLCEDPKAYERPVEEVIEELSRLVSSIRNCTDIILLQPGITEDEWHINLGALHHLEKILHDDSSLSIDITCGFRTLPIYEFLSVLYMQNTSAKSITVDRLTYAMMDESFGNETRFVDLNPITDLLDYIRVIREYNRYGTIHSFVKVSDRAEDLRSMSEDVQNVLESLSNVISFNDIQGFTEIVRKCHRLSSSLINEKGASLELRLLSEHIFQEISDRFYHLLSDDYMLQYELALWHLDRKRLLVAVTTAKECTISFIAELLRIENCSSERRNDISYALCAVDKSSGLAAVSSFKNTYKEINNIRNRLAHPHGSRQDNKIILDSMKRSLLKIQELYKNYFSNPKTHSQYREVLCSSCDPSRFTRGQNYRR